MSDDPIEELHKIRAGVQSITDVALELDRNNRVLAKRIQQLEGEKKALVLQNAILRQRPDLPLNRIPAARTMAALYEQLAILQVSLETARRDVLEEARKRCAEIAATSYGAAGDGAEICAEAIQELKGKQIV